METNRKPRVNYKPLRRALLATVRQVLTALRPELTLKRDLRSLGRTRKDVADQTREIDVRALQIYTEGLQARLPDCQA